MDYWRRRAFGLDLHELVPLSQRYLMKILSCGCQSQGAVDVFSIENCIRC
jgi:hypothetical protein